MKIENWMEKYLGEVVTFQRGFDLTEKNRKNGNIPVYGSAGVNGYHNTAKVKGPGVTIGRSGASFGVANYAPSDYWPHNTVLYVKDFHGNNERFVYYFLKNFDFASYNSGSAQPSLNRNYIHRIAVSIPPLKTQRKIAAILSAYDDLIENNTRRIQILEEMAQRIYREWFVHFRFPGHEGVKMVDSELGMIPEGWGIKTLDDVCIIVMGQSPKSEYYNEKGIGLPFHQGVKDFDKFFPTNRIFCTVDNRIAAKGDILFSVRAPVGRINIAVQKMVIGRGLSAIRSRYHFQSFMYWQLKEKFKEEDIIGGGTIFKAVTKDDMVNMKILSPSNKLTEYFESISKQFLEEIELLTKKNNNLRQTRDLLLPKLISGKLDVADLDIAVGVQENE